MYQTQKVASKEAFVERVLNRVLTQREEREAREMAMLWERVKEMERVLEASGLDLTTRRGERR